MYWKKISNQKKPAIMRIDKKILLIIIFGAILSTLQGQQLSKFTPELLDTSRNYGFFNLLKLDIHRGSNATSSGTDWVKDMFTGSGYWALDFRVGWQSTGMYAWEQAINYPQYGFGFSSFIFDERDVNNLLGQPSGLFAWAGFPIIWNKRKTFHFNIDAAAGVTYDVNPYDPITNPYNDALGSKILAYFDFAAVATWRLSRRLDMNLGLNLIHFSNGRTRTPNLGVNLLGLNLGMVYHYNPVKSFTRKVNPDYQPAIRPEFIHRPLAKFRGYNIWNFFAAAGWNTTQVSVPPDLEETDTFDIRGPSYFASTLAAEFSRKHTRITAYSVGLNYHFDGSLGEVYPSGKDWSLWDRSTVGIAFGYELFIERFSIFAQLGLYMFQNEIKKQERGSMYIRGGLRGRLTPHLFAYAALKTMNGAVADYIEWGIGYSIFNEEKWRKSMAFE